eukprot:TRINITY_DN689_c0_g1_i1.p1 TRINITY_DN689_c0_g1~~TRINITY_DN689_c0_g1_i1.p1  ORF type:complete len:186 (-),score=13.86 TRINITY_DN689_c0_g1_i1:299-856(-)
MSVKLVTSHGNITIILHYKECPKTCRNFIELAKHSYYDGVIFHRVVPDFVAQTGDPLGDGTGGESIYGRPFEDEIKGKLSHDKKGVVSMANAGHNSNTSQFFFTLRAISHLDGKYTVFGYVTEDSLSVLDDIAKVKVKDDKPVSPVKIFSAEVLENPWSNETSLPSGCSIPEKPLLDSKKKCSIM